MTPDDFRVQVYGTRWYCDPLPACPLADATKDRWPAVSTVKKAWSKPFRKKLPSGEVVPLDAFWAASYAVEHRDEIASLDPDAALQAVASAAGRTLNRAAERGTDIHTVIEDLVAGQIVDPMFLSEEARPYFAACEQFVADCKPQPIVAEVVAINRTVGYGGTLDAIIELDGIRYLTDWKTRGGAHGAYEEEAAQVGAYSLAEYIVVDGVRVSMPQVDAGLIVSFTVDGYELYPVDLAAATEAFKAMHDCWRLRRDGSKKARGSIGSPLNLKSFTEQRAGWLAEQVTRLRDDYPQAFTELASRWPADLPTFKQGAHSAEQLQIVALLVSTVEAKHGIPFGSSDPTVAKPAKQTVAEVVERLKALPADLLAAVQETAARLEVPNLESHRCTVAHLAVITELVADAEAAAKQRTSTEVHDKGEAAA